MDDERWSAQIFSMSGIERLSELSEREQEVLNFAADGLIDQQIALRMSVSTSTVNSYWVRIRGKLGHLTRTELVALLLRNQAQESIGRLEQERDDLRAAMATQIGDDSLLGRSSLLSAILENVCDPILALTASMEIVYSNLAARKFFGYVSEEELKLHVATVMPQVHRERQLSILLGATAAPGITRLGTSQVIYFQNQSKMDVRVILTITVQPFDDTNLAVCVLRPFTEEIDLMKERAREAATINF